MARDLLPNINFLYIFLMASVLGRMLFVLRMDKRGGYGLFMGAALILKLKTKWIKGLETLVCELIHI